MIAAKQLTLLPEDRKRLWRQQDAVERVMADGSEWTLRTLADRVGAGEASVSARLREARKHGWLLVKRRDATRPGLWWYALVRP